MKILLLLPLLAVTGCANFTPWGSGLVGTDADVLYMEGDKTKGTYRVAVWGLNQSRGTGQVADLGKVKLFTGLAGKTVEEVGSLGSEALGLAQ